VQIKSSKGGGGSLGNLVIEEVRPKNIYEDDRAQVKIHVRKHATMTKT